MKMKEKEYPCGNDHYFGDTWGCDTCYWADKPEKWRFGNPITGTWIDEKCKTTLVPRELKERQNQYVWRSAKPPCLDIHGEEWAVPWHHDHQLVYDEDSC